jgi:hypothetical protein
VIHAKASKLRSRLRALNVVAVADAAATFGVIHAKASKLRSRLRALNVVAVAAAAAPSGVIHAKASKLRSRRFLRGRRCGGSLWRTPRESEQVAKQVASAQT